MLSASKHVVTALDIATGEEVNFSPRRLYQMPKEKTRRWLVYGDLQDFYSPCKEIVTLCDCVIFQATNAHGESGLYLGAAEYRAEGCFLCSLDDEQLAVGKEWIKSGKILAMDRDIPQHSWELHVSIYRERKAAILSYLAERWPAMDAATAGTEQGHKK